MKHRVIVVSGTMVAKEETHDWLWCGGGDGKHIVIHGSDTMDGITAHGTREGMVLMTEKSRLPTGMQILDKTSPLHKQDITRLTKTTTADRESGWRSDAGGGQAGSGEGGTGGGGGSAKSRQSPSQSPPATAGDFNPRPPSTQGLP